MKWIKRILWTCLAIVLLLSGTYYLVSYRQETQVINDATRVRAPGQFIKLTHGLTHYVSLGSDNDTPILFIHGGGITGLEVWNNNAPFFLSQGYRVILYDLYGRGFSDRLQQEYTPQVLLDQLEDLIAALAITKPVTLVSMSLGSMIAVEYASLHPDRVNKVVLIDPALTGDYRPHALLKIPVLSEFLMTLYWYPRAVENQRKEFVNQAAFGRYAERLRFFMNFEGYKKMNYSTWMHTLNQNKLPLLATLSPHTCILIYGNRDPYFPVNNVALYLKTYPTLGVREIYDAGHMPHLERAPEVNQIILDFLY